jgi:peptidoglycan/xylan/chitin deacetylase (PgdA/CDA1 family)
MHRVGRIRAIFAVLAASGVVLICGGAAGAVVARSPSTSAQAGSGVTADMSQSSSPEASADSLTASTGRTIVTFAWGGGNASQMPGLPLFRQYGMHATYYVPSGLVCFPSKTTNCATSQYLTLSDLHKIAADGNEIGGLSVNHIELGNLPTAEAKREVCNDRVNLTGWGFTVTDFAYPFAVEHSRAEVLVKQCGYNSGLGAGQVAGAGICERCGLYAETVPPKDPMLIRAPVEVNASAVHWTPNTFESIVRTAQEHGGGWIVFLIHDICPGYCKYGITKPQLQQVLAWMHGHSGPDLRVETVRQVIGGRAKRAVEGPAPPKIGGAGVINANLTNVSNGQPACFQPADYGSNSVRFSYQPGAGPGGAGAETVNMTSARSGDAKLLEDTDLGECSPSIAAGRKYVIGVWYKSSSPTQFDLYYRNRIGVWAYWTSSARWGTAATWKHVSWTTPAAPADATAVSFGLAVGQPGQVTTTGYSVAAAPADLGPMLTFIAIGLLIAAPLVGWKVWRPRLAGTGRSGAPGSGGTSAPPGAGELTVSLVAGSKWMAEPPAHQMVIRPLPDDPAVAGEVPVSGGGEPVPGGGEPVPGGDEPVPGGEMPEGGVPAGGVNEVAGTIQMQEPPDPRRP